jgi:hypothetical protein
MIKEAGSSLDKIVSATIVLADEDDFAGTHEGGSGGFQQTRRRDSAQGFAELGRPRPNQGFNSRACGAGSLMQATLMFRGVRFAHLIKLGRFLGPNTGSCRFLLKLLPAAQIARVNQIAVILTS